MNNTFPYNVSNLRPSNHAAILATKGQLIICALPDFKKGFTIDTNGYDNWNISFKPIDINEHTNIGAIYFAKDMSDRLKVIAQWALIQSPEEPMAILLINGKTEGQYLQTDFFNNGAGLFELSNKQFTPTQNEWRVAGTFDLSGQPLVLSGIGLDTKSVFNINGNLIYIQMMQSFYINGCADNCNKKMLHHTGYPIDRVKVFSSLKPSSGISQNALDCRVSKVIFTLEGVKNFSISDIQSSHNPFAASLDYSHN